ncbi:MAG: ABC transporter ATP-binding protein [Clostridiales bacterium]
MGKNTKIIKSLWGNFIFSFLISWKSSSKLFIVRIVMEIFSGIHPVLLLYLVKLLIDSISNNLQPEEKINNAIIILITIFIIEFVVIILTRLGDIVNSVHTDKISNYINIQTMEKSKTLDIAFFDSPDFYNILQLAQRDSNSLHVFSWLSLNLIKSFVMITSTFLIMVKLFWGFPILIILLSVPAVLMENKFMLHLYNWGIKRVPEERKMDYIRSILTTREYAKEIRLFNIFDNLINRYNKYWRMWFDEKLQITKKKGLWVSISAILPQIGVVVVTIYVTINIIYKKSTIGDYSLYTGSSAELIAAISSLIHSITSIYDNSLRIDNYRKFINLKHVIATTGKKIPDKKINIEFKNVTFIYPNTKNKILDDMNFKIDCDEKIAIVGLNGQGKSTIIKLILRFYDPTNGEILINGLNIKEYDLVELRKLFGVVFQDYSNYAFTLRENIGISDLKSINDDARIINACEQSGMENLLYKWDEGLEAYLTKKFEDSGKELSGGEWQKIALARAFFKKSEFIILDEPTSSIDPEAESNLYNKISTLCEGKGALFVSHRLSSIIMSDRILVIKKGKLHESGSHKDLIKLGGFYSYLFNLQAEKYNLS